MCPYQSHKKIYNGRASQIYFFIRFSTVMLTMFCALKGDNSHLFGGALHKLFKFYSAVRSIIILTKCTVAFKWRLEMCCEVGPKYYIIST